MGRWAGCGGGTRTESLVVPFVSSDENDAVFCSKIPARRATRCRHVCAAQVRRVMSVFLDARRNKLSKHCCASILWHPVASLSEWGPKPGDRHRSFDSINRISTMISSGVVVRV